MAGTTRLTHLGHPTPLILPSAECKGWQRPIRERLSPLEGSAAEIYQRYLVPGMTTKWADNLVHRAQLRAGEDVLDVACGTGVVARLAARKVTPGHVTGLDLNSGMLAVARNVSNGGEPISWKEGSALDLPFSSGHFDAVLCQLGLQFFPDQP